MMLCVAATYHTVGAGWDACRSAANRIGEPRANRPVCFDLTKDRGYNGVARGDLRESEPEQ